MSGRRSQRGSEWSIWDLHVHTPASLVHHYGADSDATWERFFTEIESLPDDVSVIGINDYWFLDGYRRVVEARRDGRMKNIATVFPVVEMRLNQFGGSRSSLSRVNVHVLFDPELGVDVIEQQFVNRLNGEFALSPDVTSATWSGAVSRDSLADLGRRLKASVPDVELHRYGSDLMEGFNNLVVPLEQVQTFRQSTYLAGRTLLGVGKTEWADMKWNDQSVASKKTIVDQAAFLFTAYQDPTRWKSDVEVLRASRVNAKVLDCSDAHRWSDSAESERIGNCQTWLNTTPTFTGLVHALAEFDHRVYVGLEPSMLGRVRSTPEQYIDSVSIARSEGEEAPLFDYTLPLNSGFVAVVGNKGQGKSALLDCIALGGNSSRNDDFAFLNRQRFLSPTNKAASSYQVALQWKNGVFRKIALAEKFSHAHQVSVEYLPQLFVERICSSDPAGQESDAFEQELKDVLFTHIPESQRAGEARFDQLLGRVTRASQDLVDRLRVELKPVVASYLAAVEFVDRHTLSDIEARITAREVEIAAAEQDLVRARTELSRVEAAEEKSAELERLRRRTQEFDLQIERAEEQKTVEQKSAGLAQQSSLALDSIRQRLGDLRAAARHLDEELEILRSRYGVESTGRLVDVVVTDELLDRIGDRASAAETSAGRRESELVALVGQLVADRDLVLTRLAAEDGARELARRKVVQGEQRLRDLHGSEEVIESYQWLRALRDDVKSGPTRLEAAEDALIDHARSIHEAMSTQLADVATLYRPAADFMAVSPALRDAGLSFVAVLQFAQGWRKLCDHLDGRRTGELIGQMSEAPETIDPADWPSLGGFLKDCLQRLRRERGASSGQGRSPALSLKTTSTLASFVSTLLDLRWLDLRIGLIGDGLPLAQLSPGQRGLVLALFYLVVDRRTTPLLLDQPEENLDNETIHSRLVPAIREAAARRQTIIVTHNANLAVVGDADQVVHCRLQDGRFLVTSGSMTEMEMARHVVDVLEGTKIAFDNRRAKYEAVRVGQIA